MDVNRSQGNGNAQQRYRDAMVDLVRRTRGKVHAAREEAVRSTTERAPDQEIEARTEADRRDRVEISPEQQERIQHHRISNHREDNADEKPPVAQLGTEAKPAGEPDSRDRVDISRGLHARVQAARIDNAEGDDRMKVERLRMAYESGALNTPERIERSAENILRGGGDITVAPDA